MFVRVTSYVLYFIPFFHCDLYNPSNISPIHTMIHVFCTSYSSKYCFPYTMILIEIPCSICMFIKHTVFLSLFLHFTNQIITNNRFLSFLYAHPNSIQVLLFQWLCSLSPISWNVVVYYSFTTDDNSPIIGMLFVSIEPLTTIIHSSFLNRFLSLSYSHRCNNQYLINDCVCPTFHYSKYLQTIPTNPFQIPFWLFPYHYPFFSHIQHIIHPTNPSTLSCISTNTL